MEDFDHQVEADGGADDGDQDGLARFNRLSARGLGGGWGGVDFGVGDEFFRHREYKANVVISVTLAQVQCIHKCDIYLLMPL